MSFSMVQTPFFVTFLVPELFTRLLENSQREQTIASFSVTVYTNVQLQSLRVSEHKVTDHIGILHICVKLFRRLH